MSASVDARRREDAHAAAVERGKAQLRMLQAVLRHFVDGLSAGESSAALGLHLRTVRQYRSLLHLVRWEAGVDTRRTSRSDSSHDC